MTRRRFVLDCDPGIDDALAIVVLVDAVRRNEIDLAAVIAVGGNVGVERTSANAAFLVDRFHLDCPVHAGSSEPIAGPMPGDAAHVHGDDGIGGLYEPVVDAPAPSTPTELASVIEQLAPITLVATGPLTDVARLLECRPDLPDLVERLVVMGGAFGDPPGNVTDLAEFNIWVDPEAAERTFASGLRITLVPLDVTTKVVLDRADADAFAAAAGHPTLVSELVRRGADLYEALGLAPACEMHDPLAAAVALSPDLVPLTPMAVTVSTAGPSRGQTSIATDGRTPIEVALRVDAPAVVAHLATVLGRVTDG